RASRPVDAVGTRTQGAAGARHVPQEEVARVHEDVPVAFGSNGESPENGLGKGVLDRSALQGVRAARPEGVIRLNQQHFRADPLEHDDAAATFLATVEADVVRSKTGGQAWRIEELRLEPRNFQPERAGALVPIKREVAVELLHSGCSFFDGLGSLPSG